MNLGRDRINRRTAHRRQSVVPRKHGILVLTRTFDLTVTRVDLKNKQKTVERSRLRRKKCSTTYYETVVG